MRIVTDGFLYIPNGRYIENKNTFFLFRKILFYQQRFARIRYARMDVYGSCVIAFATVLLLSEFVVTRVLNIRFGDVRVEVFKCSSIFRFCIYSVVS